MLKASLSMKENSAMNQNNSTLDKPIQVTDNTFTQAINRHSLVVVDCWAAWCGPCHMIAPIIEALARDYAGKIVFGKLNVDENRGTAMKFGIMSIPTLLVFKNGALVDRIVGALPRQTLEPQITRHL
ncbi:MAG: thioredoxin [Candidatus Bathyarchaeota archaeon]|nr:MAG: thioredoxin [Candidatus Bathyarchaeota archaeon]